jgi:hypothetical protein
MSDIRQPIERCLGQWLNNLAASISPKGGGATGRQRPRAPDHQWLGFSTT